jgi:SWI/SNF-related matrix-associated actin-dependent regulator 1 of chromatin subfamily A
MPNLFPYQRAGVEFLLSQKNSLLADEMGLGKTAQAIEVINRLSPKSVLIICPASLKYNWEAELNIWLKGFYDIGIASGSYFPDTEITIINYDILEKNHRHLYRAKWGLAILDEAHYVKNRKSKRAGEALRIPADRRIFVTGTPIINRPAELYPILKSSFPDKIGTFWQYAEKFCGASRDNNWDSTGATNLDQLNKLLKPFMIRRLKNDVLKDLPPKIRQVVKLEDKDAVDREIKALQKLYPDRTIEQIASMIENNEIDVDAHIAVIRHQTALAKLPRAMAFISEMLEEGVEKIVVFAYHRDVLDMLKYAFKDSVVIHGGVSSEARNDAVRLFQNNKSPRVFIGQITAAGVGITLTAASRVVFVESSWSPAEMNQAEDRCHRIGAKDTVNVYHLVLKDSLDEAIAGSLIYKQKIFDKVMA